VGALPHLSSPSIAALTAFQAGAKAVERHHHFRLENSMNRFLKSIGSVLLVCAVGAAGGLGAAHGYLGLKPRYISGDYSIQREHANE
jgi:hypothetical protein